MGGRAASVAQSRTRTPPPSLSRGARGAGGQAHDPTWFHVTPCASAWPPIVTRCNPAWTARDPMSM
eukprot:1383028-Prymnesium_polylepis.1